MKTKTKSSSGLYFFLSIFALLSMQSCELKELKSNLKYEDASCWVSLPIKMTKKVDLFYLYPTVSDNETGNMDIENKEECDLAIAIFKAQASVFEEETNIFAPYYRQMSTAVIDPEPTETKAFKKGLSDVKAAFEYYLKNYNEGRPFIIAGHSQGSMAALEMIKEEYGNDSIFHQQLVAAYIIGWSVLDSDLLKTNLKIAQEEDDIHCIVTFNTVERDSVGGPMLLKGAHCINPLNWKTNDTYASRNLNKGACIYNNDTGVFETEIDSFCCAQINVETGALTTILPNCIKERLDLGPYAGTGIYHRYDYAFWYRNLQRNVSTRIAAYWGDLESSFAQ
jgi:hypothetical protein